MHQQNDSVGRKRLRIGGRRNSNRELRARRCYCADTLAQSGL